jgi:hypothetical protein
MTSQSRASLTSAMLRAGALIGAVEGRVKRSVDRTYDRAPCPWTCFCCLFRANDVRSEQSRSRSEFGAGASLVSVRGDCRPSCALLPVAERWSLLVCAELSGTGVVGAGAQDDPQDVPGPRGCATMRSIEPADRAIWAGALLPDH